MGKGRKRGRWGEGKKGKRESGKRLVWWGRREGMAGTGSRTWKKRLAHAARVGHWFVYFCSNPIQPMEAISSRTQPMIDTRQLKIPPNDRFMSKEKDIYITLCLKQDLRLNVDVTTYMAIKILTRLVSGLRQKACSRSLTQPNPTISNT